MTRARNRSRIVSYSARPRISPRSTGFIRPPAARTPCPQGMRRRHAVRFGERPRPGASASRPFSARIRRAESGAVRHHRRRLDALDPARELLRVAPAHLVVLRLHSPRAVDRRALLDDLDLGVREERRARAPPGSRSSARAGDRPRGRRPCRAPVREVAHERLVPAELLEELHHVDRGRGDACRASGVPRSSGHSFRIMYPHVGCSDDDLASLVRPRATSDATFVRALARAASMSPPSRFGIPQHVCSGRTTAQPFFSSTRTAHAAMRGKL